MEKIKHYTKWYLIPLMLILLAEIFVGKWSYIRNSWYRPIEGLMANGHKIDAIFVGSSRVASAIDTVSFDKAMTSHLNRNFRSMNMGTGLSTIREHLLALRNLAHKYPAGFNNLTIFVEAPMGLPELNGLNEEWFAEAQPQYLLTEMNFSDLLLYWKSTHPLARKVALTFRFLLSPLNIFTFRERIRDGFIKKIVQVATKVLTSAKVFTPGQSKVDLNTSGDVRNDEEGVRKAREYLKENMKLLITNEKPLPAFKNSSVAAIAKLAKENGGKVVFFEVPISSYQRVVYETPLRAREKNDFQATIKNEGLLYLAYNKFLDDDLFPDLMHLSNKYHSNFSIELAENYFSKSNSL